jgi:hypothetical protein
VPLRLEEALIIISVSLLEILTTQPQSLAIMSMHQTTVNGNTAGMIPN